MSTHIGRTVIDVVPVPETPQEASAPRSPWSATERVRRELARAERLARRTAAEGFDD